MKKNNRWFGCLLMLLLFSPFAAAAQTSVCETGALAPVGAYEQGEAVKSLQTCLISSGFNIPAGVTGYYGSQTIAAVKSFYENWYGAWNGMRVGPLGIENLKKGFNANKVVISGDETFKNFTSASDFKAYFKKAAQESDSGKYTTFEGDVAVPAAEMSQGSSLGWNWGMMGGADFMSGGTTGTSATAESQAKISIDRVSQTNVQVSGIDEPDIVKTDGKKIYYSSTTPISWWGWNGGVTASSVACYDCYQKSDAKIINALPLSSMGIDSTLKTSGDMLLSNNILAVFSGNEINAYNVANPKSPVKKWTVKPEGNTSIIGSRLYDGKIYMVSRTVTSDADTCPIRPLSVGGTGVYIPCGRIYHPERILPANATFSVFIIDVATGSVIAKNSFVGIGNSSVVYMSPENLYITYPAYESNFNITAGLLKERMRDLVDNSLIERIEKLAGYDISSSSKMVELNTILNNYRNSLDSDARLKFNNEMSNRLSNYRKAQKRQFDRTIIAKIGLSGLEYLGSGSVPGQPLNQFSLDEYDGNLRIATTVGDSWQMRTESASDVYVLDGNMDIIGSVLGLGKTEKIYSARFIKDKGYVVTFRQTDPFYVINLKDPKNPKLAGELKIPGYSGYLHPVNKDKIIGIGMENSRVKISYFNVSDPYEPVEMDKYSLDEYWSEAVSNHHAFLMDDGHSIFFMPAGNGGYVFSYENDKLELLKAVSVNNPKRAVYINDYLYIIGDNKISVLNENTWEKVKEFDLSE